MTGEAGSVVCKIDTVWSNPAMESVRTMPVGLSAQRVGSMVP